MIGTFSPKDMDFDGEWKSAPGSRYFESPYLYKENGFKERKTAEALTRALSAVQPMNAVLQAIEKMK